MDQRARILDAMVLVVYEHGFAGATVKRICAGAKVGRATFYEAFDGPRDCFLEVIDDGYRRTREVVERAFEQHEHWLEGVRASLASLLVFFDGEPRLARVWLIETLGAGAWALERRERHTAALTSMIVERWPVPADAQVSPLAATAVMESVLGIVRARVLDGSEGSLVELLGPLMGLVTAPYLPREAVAAEVLRAERFSSRLRAVESGNRSRAGTKVVVVPDLLYDRRAVRARRCLLHVAGHPGASNRSVARAVGIGSDTQISALLARLRRMGLLELSRARHGGPNSWRATSYGMRVAQALRENMDGWTVTDDRTPGDSNVKS